MTSSELSIIYPFNYYLLRIIMYFNTVFIPTSKKNLYRSKMFHVWNSTKNSYTPIRILISFKLEISFESD